MPKQIIINDLDQNKEESLKEFLKEGSNKSLEYLDRDITYTDSDYEQIFTKLASEKGATNFSQLKEIVHDSFEGKLDDKLETWGDKLALDRTRLSEVFKKTKK